MSRVQLWPLLFVVAACSFPRPPDVAGDDDAPDDAGVPPGISIRVSGTGDDANDGVTKPVKTLKQAIGLAAASSEITSIVLASGRYSTAGGETYPYTVPPNVTVIGPAGGGAILAGSNTEPGLVLGAGALQDLELEDFTVAITATGTARITDLRIRTKTVAIRAGMTAALTVDNLDIAGAPGVCATGIVLEGSAALTATNLVTRSLKTTVNAQGQSSVALSRANITGDVACSNPRIGVFTLSTTKTFLLKDSLIDGGDYGVYFVGTGEPTQATIVNTNIVNTKDQAISGGHYTLNITGGELISNGGAIAADRANVVMNGVVIKQQRSTAADLGREGSFSMRNCIVADTSLLYLNSNMAIDLGTAESPGQNEFRLGGLSVESGVNMTIYAVGNTWRANVQGADATGRYASALVPGPVSGANYSMYAGAFLQF